MKKKKKKVQGEVAGQSRLGKYPFLSRDVVALFRAARIACTGEYGPFEELSFGGLDRWVRICESENGFDRDLPLHFLFRNFQLRISSSCFKFFLGDSHGKKNNIYHEGLTRWTTKPEKEYDPALFRNGGLTYWEIEQPPYKPPVAVCLFFQLSLHSFLCMTI